MLNDDERLSFWILSFLLWVAYTVIANLTYFHRVDIKTLSSSSYLLYFVTVLITSIGLPLTYMPLYLFFSRVFFSIKKRYDIVLMRTMLLFEFLSFSTIFFFIPKDTKISFSHYYMLLFLVVYYSTYIGNIFGFLTIKRKFKLVSKEFFVLVINILFIFVFFVLRINKYSIAASFFISLVISLVLLLISILHCSRRC